ncbi:hypothetical protein MRB53_033100, partial [Persea americana]
SDLGACMHFFASLPVSACNWLSCFLSPIWFRYPEALLGKKQLSMPDPIHSSTARNLEREAERKHGFSSVDWSD